MASGRFHSFAAAPGNGRYLRKRADSEIGRSRRKPDITFAAVNVVVGPQAVATGAPGGTPALWQLALTP
jgi:hypothetical protein